MASTPASPAPGVGLKAAPPAAAAQIQAGTEQLFAELAKYIEGELTMTSEDYRLLEQMNQLTRQRYLEMTATAERLVTTMTTVQTKYQQLESFLPQIDALVAGVSELETTVQAIDDYTAQVERRVDALVAGAPPSVPAAPVNPASAPAPSAPASAPPTPVKKE